MGIIVSAGKFSPENLTGLPKPIIYCVAYPGITDQAVSLNIRIARMLETYSAKHRTMQVERCFHKALSELPDGIVICGIDVLFNPEYKIDVMKILVKECKLKPYSLVWPGRLTGNKLIYAEEGYMDYKEYDVGEYNITCVS